jgi:hypothetical protein
MLAAARNPALKILSEVGRFSMVVRMSLMAIHSLENRPPVSLSVIRTRRGLSALRYRLRREWWRGELVEVKKVEMYRFPFCYL